MTQRHTVVRALHDVGAAAWFGGSLMGAVALNGAAGAVEDPTGRVRVASVGWAKWTPVNAAAIGAYLIGGAELLALNRDRVRLQSGVTANTAVKALLTVAAVGATAYSGVLGAKLAQAGDVAASGAVVPSTETPQDVAAAQQRPAGLTATETTPAAPATYPSPDTLTTEQLCLAWRTSFTALQKTLDVAGQARLAQRRRDLLDELERRDPAGFARWFAAGARAASNPARYLAQPSRHSRQQRT